MATAAASDDGAGSLSSPSSSSSSSSKFDSLIVYREFEFGDDDEAVEFDNVLIVDDPSTALGTGYSQEMRVCINGSKGKQVPIAVYNHKDPSMGSFNSCILCGHHSELEAKGSGGSDSILPPAPADHPGSTWELAFTCTVEEIIARTLVAYAPKGCTLMCSASGSDSTADKTVE